VGSPSYKISKYLVKLIQPILKNDISVKNSAVFVNEAKTWDITPREIQVSFDIVAMYPSIPVNKAIDVIMDMLSKDFDNIRNRTPFKLGHIKSLMTLCLNNSYFMWNNEIRQLIDSGPIGLSLMVVVAEGFIQDIEKRAFAIAKLPSNSACPITNRRYVDDSHDRFSTKRKCDKFLDIINSIEPNIKFTVEYENDKKELNFLDTTIINTGERKYEFKIHRKAAITNVQIKLNSCHDEKVKYGVFKGFIHRAHAICSEKYLEEELEFITKVFVENGYSEEILRKMILKYRSTKDKNKIIVQQKNFVSLPFVPNISYKLRRIFQTAGFTVMFKSGRNLKSILTSRNKPKLPKNSYPGVYKVPCKCSSCYIGHTGKQIKTRGSEHEKAIFMGKWEDSALALHTKECQEGIEWENFVTLSNQPYYYKRTVMESLEIQREEVCNCSNPIINDRAGQFVTTDAWKPLFRKIGLKSK